MMARPVCASFLITRTTINAARPSKPVVGSSKKIKLGFATTSQPIVTRFNSSNERPAPGGPTTASAIGSSSRTRITSCTNCSFFLYVTSLGIRSSALNCKASRTVM
jgi:hypothetical protein